MKLPTKFQIKIQEYNSEQLWITIKLNIPNKAEIMQLIQQELLYVPPQIKIHQLKEQY